MAPPILKSSIAAKQQSKSVSFQSPAAPTNKEQPPRKRPRVRQEDDQDDDDVYGVDTTYDEGGAESSYDKFHAQKQPAKPRRRRNDDIDDDEDDGEEDIDAAFSLLGERSKDDTPIEAFNLQEERTSGEGYFDGDMYVFRRRNADDEEEDAWLQSVKEEQEQLGAVFPTSTARKNGDGDESSDSEDDDEDGPNVGTGDQLLGKAKVIQEILALLATSKETISDAMRRYGRISKLKFPSKEQVTDGSLAQGKAKQCLQRLTALANQLVMTYHENDVYEKSAEELQLWNQILTAAQNMEQPANGNAVSDNANETGGSVHDGSSRYFASMSTSSATTDREKTPVQWEYYGQDDNIHGPFATGQMLQWIQQGYFIGESAVRVRRVRDATASSGSATAREEKNATATVEDLMADLEDSDQEDGGEKQGDFGGSKQQRFGNESEWVRSDEIDFSCYL